MRIQKGNPEQSASLKAPVDGDIGGLGAVYELLEQTPGLAVELVILLDDNQRLGVELDVLHDGFLHQAMLPFLIRCSIVQAIQYLQTNSHLTQ